MGYSGCSSMSWKNGRVCMSCLLFLVVTLRGILYGMLTLHAHVGIHSWELEPDPRKGANRLDISLSHTLWLSTSKLRFRPKTQSPRVWESPSPAELLQDSGDRWVTGCGYNYNGCGHAACHPYVRSVCSHIMISIYIYI